MKPEPHAGTYVSSRSEFTLRIGPVQIHLRADPIEAVIRTTDLEAIVSSDDSVLSMAGGVSAAIAALAGTAIRDEVASNLPLPVGAVAVTSGGRLPIKYIIHAVTVGRTRRVSPKPRAIRQLFRGILSRCEALGVSRIAVPALATGAAGFPPGECARILAEALREHLLNPTVLQSVVLSLPDPSVRQAFAGELSRPSLSDLHTSEEELARVRATADGVSAISPGTWLLEWLHGVRNAVKSAEAPGSQTTEQSTPPFGHLIDRSSSEVPATAQTIRALEHLIARTSLLAGSVSSRPLLSGRYVLLEEVGRGGMTVVYLSWDLVLRRLVAIKILRPDTADPESLKREAAAALELTHEGIVRLYHFEPKSHKAEPYLVMEYLPWPSGEKWIAEAGASLLPIRAVTNVGVRVCNALVYAHSRNILHLDIKPSNIFVDPAGENAKLGDFGLARFSSAGGALLQLRPAGTPAYMAPEQTTPGAKVSAATDVYQLAATLWDFLTGSPPQRAGLDLEQFEPGRKRLLSLLLGVLAPDPAVRPSAARLREMVASVEL